MNDAHAGPVAPGEFFQPEDPGVGVAGEKQTQAVRNVNRIIGCARLLIRDSTEEQERSGLRPVMRFHRRELGRLQPAHGAGALVAT